MKKIINLFILIIVCVSSCTIGDDLVYLINTEVPKSVKINEESHIIFEDTNSISTEECEVLDDVLKKNNSVLTIFKMSDNDFVSSDRQDVDSYLKMYAKINVPYVIFNYNSKQRRLTSQSGNGAEDLNISVDNVEYTAIYDYVPFIKSTYVVREFKNKPFNFVFYIISLFVLFLIFCYNIFQFFSIDKWKCVDNYFYFKKCFWGFNIKIKLLTDNQDIVKKLVVSKKSKVKNNYAYIKRKGYSENRTVRVVFPDDNHKDYIYNIYLYHENFEPIFESLTQNKTKLNKIITRV